MNVMLKDANDNTVEFNKLHSLQPAAGNFMMWLITAVMAKDPRNLSVDELMNILHLVDVGFDCETFRASLDALGVVKIVLWSGE